MQYDALYAYFIERLKNELPDYLTYHDVDHTLSVIKYSEYFAKSEQISEDNLIILKTAALLHDSGFIVDPHPLGHEQRSCTIARKILPSYGYENWQIEEICNQILATKIPQEPNTILEKIICDADLYYLGTTNYPKLANTLKLELKHAGSLNSEESWHNLQINFLREHQFFTSKAKEELNAMKKVNLKNLEKDSKTFKKLHTGTQETIRDLIIMGVGVMIAAFALKGFLVPNKFFDGGVTGLSLLIHELYHLNLGIVIVLLNLPLILIGYYSVGKKFAIRTFIAVFFLGLFLTFLPEFDITHDKLLISIFGGVFLGIGVGLNMRTGAALDGIEVLAVYTLKRTSFTITEIILGINIIIFTIAAFKFGIETALYSILTYFTASRTIDYVVEGLQAFTGVTIISSESEMIKYQLVNNLKRGITVYKGERGFLPENFEVSTDCDIIFTVITRLELRKLKNLVHEVDPNAFVFANTIKEASGGIISRKQHH